MAKKAKKVVKKAVKKVLDKTNLDEKLVAEYNNAIEELNTQLENLK